MNVNELFGLNHYISFHVYFYLVFRSIVYILKLLLNVTAK